MAYKNEWQAHGKGGKRYVDAPYDALIEPVADGTHRGCWRATVRKHVEGGVCCIHVSRAFKLQRLAKSHAISTILEHKLRGADRTSSPPRDQPRASRASS